MRLVWAAFLQILGWKAVNKFPHSVRKGVILVAPHTSSWDFILGLAFRSTLRIKNAKYLGKQELFKGPFGFIFRWLGGTPVDRSSKQGLVEQVVEKFENTDSLYIALSPEGTRKKVDKLRTGFWYIADKSKLPIIMVGLNYATKQLSVAEPFYTSGNIENDLKKIIEHYYNIRGRNPHNDLHHFSNTNS